MNDITQEEVAKRISNLDAVTVGNILSDLADYGSYCKEGTGVDIALRNEYFIKLIRGDLLNALGLQEKGLSSGNYRIIDRSKQEEQYNA